MEDYNLLVFLTTGIVEREGYVRGWTPIFKVVMETNWAYEKNKVLNR